MLKTDNYELNLAESTDKYNHFSVDNSNYEIIDEEMKKNADAGTQVATELFTDTIHAITRLKPDSSVFRFTAVSRFTAGDTFTVDDVQVSALTTSGEQLPDGAFVIGSEVLCCLKGTRLTVYLSTGSVNKAKDADKLGGQLPSYYASAGDLADVAQVAQAAGELAEENTQEINILKETLGNAEVLVYNNTTKDSSIDTKAHTLDFSKYREIAALVGDFEKGNVYCNCRANVSEINLISDLSTEPENKKHERFLISAYSNAQYNAQYNVAFFKDGYSWNKSFHVGWPDNWGITIVGIK